MIHSNNLWFSNHQQSHWNPRSPKSFLSVKELSCGLLSSPLIPLISYHTLLFLLQCSHQQPHYAKVSVVLLFETFKWLSSTCSVLPWWSPHRKGKILSSSLFASGGLALPCDLVFILSMFL